MFDVSFLRSFEATDQESVRRLILEGLGEHFDFIDESLNPDLDDIMKSYVVPGHVFMVAHIGPDIVGTGALITEAEETGRIARVSTRRAYRRKGIGKAIVEHLLNVAKQRGYKRILIATNKDWDDAIGFYGHLGFVEYTRNDVGVGMALNL